MTAPGPWKVDDDGAIRTTDGRDVVTAFDHRVVVSDADARLIAAAPDLLAACEAWLSGETTWSTTQAYEMAARAVAKAKGET